MRWQHSGMKIENRVDIDILRVLVKYAEYVTASSKGAESESAAEDIFNAKDDYGKRPVDTIWLGTQHYGKRPVDTILLETQHAEVIELLLLRMKLHFNADIIEQVLKRNLKGLKLELDNGWTLLHHCVKEGIVTPTILKALEHQLNSLDSSKKIEVMFSAQHAEVVEILLNNFPMKFSEILGVKLEQDKGWTLLHHCVKEGIITPTILKALEHQVNSMDSSKKTPIFYAEKSEIVQLFLDEGIGDLKLDFRHFLELGERGTLLQHCFNEGILTKTSLSTACEEENVCLVKLLLRTPGITDHERYDGLTGFAISLVKQNKDIAMAFLQSGIKSHSRNVFLASEFCRLPSVENIDLKNSIQQFMSSQETVHLHVERSQQIMDNEKDQR